MYDKIEECHMISWFDEWTALLTHLRIFLLKWNFNVIIDTANESINRTTHGRPNVYNISPLFIKRGKYCEWPARVLVEFIYGVVACISWNFYCCPFRRSRSMRNFLSISRFHFFVFISASFFFYNDFSQPNETR